MQRVLMLICFIPCAVQAKDVNIYVDYVVKQERVSPQSKTVHAHISQQLILREDGTISTSFRTKGKHPEDANFQSKLGKQFRVVDEHTIRGTWLLGAQKRTLTVATAGNGCTAKLEISGASEFRARSTDLNEMALYRNSEVESINCKIE